ncbi:hypothetical protein BH09MYX1_BH09MYX1_55410 [soil metagenome]
MQNRVFFPQAAFDQWLVEGAVELAGNELTILAEGRHYRIAEAVRVLSEVSGTTDENDVVGRVKSKVFFEELGAEILEGSMIIGDNAYDIIQGWLGAPATSFTDYQSSDAWKRARQSNPDFSIEEPRTDEDLLAKFLMKNL